MFQEFKPGDLVRIWGWCCDKNEAVRSIGIVVGEAPEFKGIIAIRKRIWVLIAESGRLKTEIKFLNDIEHIAIIPRVDNPIASPMKTL